MALIDCGIKHNIIRSFLQRGIRVLRLPWDADLSQVKEKFDGVFYSNGPGDPATVDKTIESMRWAMKENKVIFGICLGAQVMGLAAGAKTYKLKYYGYLLFLSNLYDFLPPLTPILQFDHVT